MNPLRTTPDGLVDMDQFPDGVEIELDAATRSAVRDALAGPPIGDEQWSAGLRRVRRLSSPIPSDAPGGAGRASAAGFDVADRDWTPIRAELRADPGYGIADATWNAGLASIRHAVAPPVTGAALDEDPATWPASLVLLEPVPPRRRRQPRRWQVLAATAAAAAAMVAVATFSSPSVMTTAPASRAAGPASPHEMVEIPAGGYPLGSDQPGPNAAETPAMTYSVSAFFIDRFEVSNADYAQFVDEKGAAPALAWVGGTFPAGEGDKPVRGVGYDWATAYCASLGKRLPTEAEWEAAARGTEGRVYPWGDDAAAGGLPDSGTYQRGSLATNVSPFGVFDLAGNAWEWVGESYDARVPKESRTLRGGQNGYLRRNSERLPVETTSNAVKIAGFRCAADQVDPAVAPRTFGDVALPKAGHEVATTVPDPTVIVEDRFDDATSGWQERSSADMRYGYHPVGFFHLETKHEKASALVEGPVAVDPTQPVAITVRAFVDPANTVADDGGMFSYGILFRSSLQQATDRNALIFVVDPRSQNWAVCNFVPETEGWAVIEKQSRVIPEEVTLEVRATGPDTYEFLIDGQQVYSKTIPGYTGTGTGMALLSYQASQKAHIHFDEFVIRTR